MARKTETPWAGKTSKDTRTLRDRERASAELQEELAAAEREVERSGTLSQDEVERRLERLLDDLKPAVTAGPSRR